MAGFPKKAKGRHRRAGRHRRRLGRPSPDRARLGRHRRHRQVRHPDRHRLDRACLGFLLHDQPRLPVLLDDALLHRFLREAGPLRAHRRPRGRARRRRRPHGRDQAQGGLGQSLRHARAADRSRRDQGKISADRGEHGAGRLVGSGRRPCHPALADRRRQAGRPGATPPASCRPSPTRRPNRWSSRTAASRAWSPTAARSRPTTSWSAPASGAG